MHAKGDELTGRRYYRAGDGVTGAGAESSSVGVGGRACG